MRENFMRNALWALVRLIGRGRIVFSVAVLAGLSSPTSQAIPLFARQTGMECVQCHAGGNFPELTTFGRRFKLTGYTLGTRETIPLSAMLVAQNSRLANRNGSADPGADFAGDRATQLQALSVFTGGKITDSVGAFVQWTYDGVAHHSAIDNVDLRFAQSTTVAGKAVVWGLTLNNNPSVSDLFNTVPAWAPPYFVPGGAFQGFGVQPLVIGGLSHVVAGLGAYVDWNDLLYFELAGYRNAHGVFSLLRTGNTNNDPASGGTGPHIISGTSPYWRLAVHRDDGPHAWMVGLHGLTARPYADTYDASSSVTRVRDISLDAQYQYLGQENMLSVQATTTRERQRYDAALVGPNAGFDNASNALRWSQARVAYQYHNRYGASLAAFASSGSADTQLYASNTNPVPDTRGTIVDLNYLPHPQVKLGLTYVAYSKFNGSSRNYDASGTFTNRNARDNNTLSLYVWATY